MNTRCPQTTGNDSAPHVGRCENKEVQLQALFEITATDYDVTANVLFVHFTDLSTITVLQYATCCVPSVQTERVFKGGKQSPKLRWKD